MQRLVVDRHLELRLLQAAEAPLLAALVDRSRDHLRAWLPWVDASLSTCDSLAFIEATRERHANREAWESGIWRDGLLAGMAGYNELDWTHRRGVIGYWLAADCQGQGIVTRCCRALLDQGFDRWGLHRVEIHCSPRNHRSRAIPRRLGFTLEGCLRQTERLHDRYEDHEVYGLLASEWPAARDGERD
ncbi:MAG: GNAT family protein [Candidatus Latescibacterota bacterium]